MCLSLHGGHAAKWGSCDRVAMTSERIVVLIFVSMFSMRKGRVVILLAGRRSGKKAIIVKSNEDGGKKVRNIPNSRGSEIHVPRNKYLLRFCMNVF